MGHRCGSNCHRKSKTPCPRCRYRGKKGVAAVAVATTPAPEDAGDAAQPRSAHPQATPQEKGVAIANYYAGLSYRRAAESVQAATGRKTTQVSVYNWVQENTKRANDIAQTLPVNTGDEWVADEMAVKVGGKQYWLFNVMDSKTRFILGAYLTEYRTSRSAQTVLALARERAANPPKTVKTDGLRSYREAVPRAFPTRAVKHVVSQGIRAEINNNLSERLQGTFRDRDKTLRGLKGRTSGQTYIDGLVLNYNYFRPHIGLGGKTPAASAGAEMPFDSWAEVAGVVAGE